MSFCGGNQRGLRATEMFALFMGFVDSKKKYSQSYSKSQRTERENEKLFAVSSRFFYLSSLCVICSFSPDWREHLKSINRQVRQQVM